MSRTYHEMKADKKYNLQTTNVKSYENKVLHGSVDLWYDHFSIFWVFVGRRKFWIFPH